MIGRLRSLLGGSSLLSHVVRLGSSTALSQGMLVAAIPVTTRLYTPADFGKFGLFMSFLSVSALAVCLRFDAAIASVAHPRQSTALLALSAALIVPMALVCTGVLLILRLNDWLSFGSMQYEMLPLMTLALVVTGLFMSLRFWLAQQLRFRELGRALLQQSAGRALAPIAAGFLGAGHIGLVVGEIIGRMFAIRRIGVAAMAACRRWLRRCDRRYFVLLARRHWKYPCILLPSSLLDAAAAAMPVPLLWTLFGADVAGYFALVSRVASVPGALIAASVADVLQAHLSRSILAGRSEARRQLLRVAGGLFATGIAIFVPTALLASWLVPAVFGARWHDAGQMLAILCPSFFVAFVVSPLSRALAVVNRLELKLFADAALTILPAVALYRLADDGWQRALGGFAAASVLAYLIYFALIMFAMSVATGANVPGRRSGAA